MIFSASVLIAFLSSVSLLTQVERVTGSSVADHFKKLGEMESVPAAGPLLQDVFPEEQGLQLTEELWVSNTRSHSLLVPAERPDRDTLELSNSDWETSKPWENDKEVEDKDSVILQGDVAGSEQFGQNSKLREKRRTFGEITWRRERARAYPGYAIGRLGNGCTAFFIGPYQALTAAHCVYKRSTRQWKKWALDIEGLYNCKKPAHVGVYKKEWVSAHVPKRYCKFGLWSEDIALIVTRQPACSDTKPCLELAEFPSNYTGNITIYGYPLHTRNQMWHRGLYWPLYCLVSSSCNDAKCIRYVYGMMSYRCDTANGMSGGPIIAFNGSGDGEDCVVYGVHSFSNFFSNYGVKFTLAKIEELKNLVCNVAAPGYPSFCHAIHSDYDSDKAGDSNADTEHMNSTNATEVTMVTTVPTTSPFKGVIRSKK